MASSPPDRAYRRFASNARFLQRTDFCFSGNNPFLVIDVKLKVCRKGKKKMQVWVRGLTVAEKLLPYFIMAPVPRSQVFFFLYFFFASSMCTCTFDFAHKLRKLQRGYILFIYILPFLSGNGLFVEPRLKHFSFSVKPQRKR